MTTNNKLGAIYCRDVGATVAIITVAQLPPSESFNRRVNLLSRYGTCRVPPCDCGARRRHKKRTEKRNESETGLQSALMQLPNALQ